MSIYSLMVRNCTYRYSPSAAYHKICEDLLLPKLYGNDRRAGYSTDADWKFAAPRRASLLRRIADSANAVTLIPRFHRGMKWISRCTVSVANRAPKALGKAESHNLNKKKKYGRVI